MSRPATSTPVPASEIIGSLPAAQRCGITIVMVTHELDIASLLQAQPRHARRRDPHRSPRLRAGRCGG